MHSNAEARVQCCGGRGGPGRGCVVGCLALRCVSLTCDACTHGGDRQVDPQEIIALKCNPPRPPPPGPPVLMLIMFLRCFAHARIRAFPLLRTLHHALLAIVSSINFMFGSALIVLCNHTPPPPRSIAHIARPGSAPICSCSEISVFDAAAV